MCFGQNSKNNKSENHKNPCLNRESNPGHLTTQSNVIPLHHRVNGRYRLFSSDLTASRQWVET